MTRRQFFIKHLASIRTVVDGTFAAVSSLADLRKCAESIDHPEMKELVANLEKASEAAVGIVAQMPSEFISTWIGIENFGVQPNNVTIKEKAA